jgi:hypothetical protein
LHAPSAPNAGHCFSMACDSRDCSAQCSKGTLDQREPRLTNQTADMHLTCMSLMQLLEHVARAMASEMMNFIRLSSMHTPVSRLLRHRSQQPAHPHYCK